MHGPAIEADDGDLVRLGLDRLEQLRGEIRPRGLQHRVAICREFAAHHVEHLGLQLVQGIEQPVLAGREHAHELSVAREATHARHPSPSRFNISKCQVMARLHHVPPAARGG
jgi:hypothetical protein